MSIVYVLDLTVVISIYVKIILNHFDVSALEIVTEDNIYFYMNRVGNSKTPVKSVSHWGIKFLSLRIDLKVS